jgi:hypothetical protein
MAVFLKALQLNDSGTLRGLKNSYGSTVYSNTSSFEDDKI